MMKEKLGQRFWRPVLGIQLLLALKAFLKRLPLLLWTAAITVGINLFYLVPVADYMLTQDMHVFHSASVDMQDSGLFFLQIMQMFVTVVGADGLGFMRPVGYGMEDELMLGVGFLC